MSDVSRKVAPDNSQSLHRLTEKGKRMDGVLMQAGVTTQSGYRQARGRLSRLSLLKEDTDKQEEDVPRLSPLREDTDKQEEDIPRLSLLKDTDKQEEYILRLSLPREDTDKQEEDIP